MSVSAKLPLTKIKEYRYNLPIVTLGIPVLSHVIFSVW